MELQNDPLLEKSSAKFDAEGVHNLFQNFLLVIFSINI